MNINIKNKTGRTNKTNQTYTWPSGFFTHKELFALNPNGVEITMRVRVKSDMEAGKIKDIGVIHNGKGRPTNILVMAPVTPAIITKAVEAGVLLHSEYLSLKIADIENTAKEVQSVEANTSDVSVMAKTTNLVGAH
jgi:hypothetical protein